MKLRSKSSIYEIQQVLSRNERSTVYEAYRSDFKYLIRQKILLKIFQKNSVFYPLELASILQVQSPYCVSVLHFENIQNQPAFILEWVDGINLFQLFRQSSFLHSNEISYICANIQEGLIDLKKQGLCHGDLNWSNILIDRKGAIRLIDFGKGNYIKDAIYSAPFITAPEILQGSRPNFLSDLFSLGVIEKCLKQEIEDTQQWGSVHSMNEDTLLDSQPKNRRIKDFIALPESKKSLAKKVTYILNQQSFTQKKSSSYLCSIKRKRFFSSYWIYLTIFALGFLNSSCEENHLLGSVQVRSHQWLFIELNNQSSFTPFDSGPLPAGTYYLKWKSQNKTGHKTIHIKEKTHLLLTDKDLK